MHTPDECLAKARELSEAAERSPEEAPMLLALAKTWSDLARTAKWQDEFEKHLI